jgi:hypothetical protein
MIICNKKVGNLMPLFLTMKIIDYLILRPVYSNCMLEMLATNVK